MSELNWDSIYQEYSGKVMGYISARVQRRADAEDLCSEVFEKVFRKMEGYDQGKASVGTWIYTITRNTVIDYFRKTRPTAELDENIASDGDSLLNNETLSELAQALKKLPQELQDIVVLMYHDGIPMTEVAKMMHLSYGAVKLRHQKALNMMRLSMGVGRD